MLFRSILGSDLWVIDDWGLVPLEKGIAEEVFDLMDRRKQTSAMILTSNRSVDEWDQVFPNVMLANATIDRIFDQAETIVLKGRSYRLKKRMETTLENELTTR